jgi:hypothetical protein
MSELDDAMEQHMRYIVFEEERPFSFADFRRFEVDGKEYRNAHGTYRNKISRFKKAGKVELYYSSGTAYYTLKGHKFGILMTPNHTGDSSSSVFSSPSS